MSDQSESREPRQRGLPILPFPIEDPLSERSLTAQKILAAARTLLIEGGYGEVTLEKVAAAAGVNKASIRYNFGDKAGLMATLVDALMHSEFALMERVAPTLERNARLDVAVDAKRRMILATDAFRGFFDILPHAIRSEELRVRVAALYPWWCEQNLRWLGLQGCGPEGRDGLVQGLGELMSAIVDGLALQAELEPEAFDPGRALRTLRFLLANSMAQLEEHAATEHGGETEGAGL